MPSVFLACQTATASELGDLLNKARAGSLDAQYELGMQYRHGRSGLKKVGNTANE